MSPTAKTPRNDSLSLHKRVPKLPDVIVSQQKTAKTPRSDGIALQATATTQLSDSVSTTRQSGCDLEKTEWGHRRGRRGGENGVEDGRVGGI
ncbi:hypothetical protein M758_10G076600 [Ceratodon purpureus]|nr:hypothetical protein M758_10G076600 [Ceratodon purpureus]